MITSSNNKFIDLMSNFEISKIVFNNYNTITHVQNFNQQTRGGQKEYTTLTNDQRQQIATETHKC